MNIKKVLFVIFIGFSIAQTTFSQKKNLLFIMTDQQRYDALGIAGNAVLKTPNLDKLASQGVWFSNAYSPCAVCGPARSSILTGCYVASHRVKTNDRTYYYDEEPVMTMPTFDEILTENGYHCEYYGKWHSMSSHTSVYRNPKQTSSDGKSIFAHGGQNRVYIDYINETYPLKDLNPGEHIDMFTQRPYVPDPLDKYYGQDFEDVKEVRKKDSQPNFHGKLLVPAEHSFTAFQAKETIEAIKRLKDTSFSITCSFHFPHAPIIAPEPYYSMYKVEDMIPPVSITDDMENSPYKTANGRMGLTDFADPEKIKYMIANYYALVTEIDHWVGEILKTLENKGLSENTLVIFTSDHGEMLGAHGLREKNIFYEESSHIPLIMRFPGEIEEKSIVDGNISLVDIFPSILDYLNIKEHPSDGRSLRDLIEGKDTDHGKFVVTEWDYRGPISPNYMIVSNNWKLILPYTTESKVLNAMYDLNTDPHEMNNLLGNNPDREKNKDKAEELRLMLLDWLKKNNPKHYNGVKDRKLI